MPTPASLRGFLEALDPIGKDARRLEPFEEVGAGAELDPLVAHARSEVGQLLERKVAVHEGVEGDPHRGVLIVLGAGRSRWALPPIS